MTNIATNRETAHDEKLIPTPSDDGVATLICGMQI